MELLNLLNNLAEIRISKKELAQKEKELLQQINPLIAPLEKDQVLEVSTGSFVVQQTTAWSYPDYVLRAEAELENLIDKAQQVGDATYTTTNYVKFNPATE
jgi:hypothetical protein